MIENGKRYEKCRRCGCGWNVSLHARVPWYGYICPYCRDKERKEREAEQKRERRDWPPYLDLPKR